jgi:hypothetical protein
LAALAEELLPVFCLGKLGTLPWRVVSLPCGPATLLGLSAGALVAAVGVAFDDVPALLAVADAAPRGARVLATLLLVFGRAPVLFTPAFNTE